MCMTSGATAISFSVSACAQHQTGATASAFFDTGRAAARAQVRIRLPAGRHRFGLGLARGPARRTNRILHWPQSRAPRNQHLLLNYYDTYLGDTLRAGNLTLNVGARFDYQQGKQSPVVRAGQSGVSGSPSRRAVRRRLGIPDTWRTVQPRVGATYAIGHDRATLLRASYSRFSNQLGSEVGSVNAFPGTAALYLRLARRERQRPRRAERDRFHRLPPSRTMSTRTHPGSAVPVNQISREPEAADDRRVHRRRRAPDPRRSLGVARVHAPLARAISSSLR